MVERVEVHAGRSAEDDLADERGGVGDAQRALPFGGRLGIESRGEVDRAASPP